MKGFPTSEENRDIVCTVISERRMYFVMRGYFTVKGVHEGTGNDDGRCNYVYTSALLNALCEHNTTSTLQPLAT